MTASPSHVQVLLPLAIDQSYSYGLPEGVSGLEPGSVVEVPLGPRAYLGVVWPETPQPLPEKVKLKEISGVRPGRALPQVLMAFVDWVAAYTLTPRGMILRMVLREPEAFLPEAPVVRLTRGDGEPERMTPSRQKVLALLEGGAAFAKKELAEAAEVGVSVIDGLLKAGHIRAQSLPASQFDVRLKPDFTEPQLTEEQAAALRLYDSFDKGFQPILLDGVTGAGKTAVYLEMVAKALGEGKEALVLIPEIALTTTFLSRFKARFGVEPLTWHSGLTSKQRQDVWRKVFEGRAQVVVGARSSLFLPFANLGLIVVDEEHEAAYKQEERGIYHARDMAVKRAQLSDCAVVLASATPSLETWANVKAGRYQHLILESRYSGQEEPPIRAIDMRGEAMDATHWLSDELKAAVASRLAKGEQSLLFLNRRGYAPLTLCRACGHRIKCPDCAAWLTEHRFKKKLMCHHCGYQSSLPEECPSCREVGKLVPCGPGVERIAEEARHAFPEAKMMVLSSDLLTNPTDMRRELESIANGDVDLIVGTQILAKGHNFPKLTLVGIVDADLGLEQIDPRAGERSFQLLHQVIGRAGRAELKGEGLVQTYNPEHPVLKALVAQDRNAFYDAELKLRHSAGMPPFGKLAGLIISSTDKALALDYARGFVRAMPASEAHVLGPAEATIAQLRGRYRFRLLVKASRNFDMQGFLRHWLAHAHKPTRDIRVQIDIDPQSFY